MLRDLFSFVLDNYINGFNKAEIADPNHDVLIHQIPLSLRSYFPMRKDLLVNGSCGVGQKTDYPWVAIFNKNITTSATRGLYIVYLYRKDMSGFYLSLNQGITYFKNTFGKKKYEYARKVANYFRNEIGDTYFDKDDIDLKSSVGSLGFGYQETNIISKFYAKGSFSEEQLKDDLIKMLAIYDELVGVLGEENYDYNKAINHIVYSGKDYLEPADEAIENIKKAISSPTDLNVVRTLRYVEPKEKGTKKYSRIRTGAPIKKIDYIEKAKADMEIGQLGEMLALQFEKERLINEGYNDLAEKVSRVSVISDAYGYDIVSYQMIGLRMEEIYIEVKTTTNKLDVPFPVSRGEVEESNKKKDRYCLFRIYDVKNENPSFYKVFGKIEENFKIDPESYLARYIGKRS